MSKTKFDAVKELINEKQYDSARALLKTIDHATAREWEGKIDAIAPPMASEKRYARNVVRLLVAILVIFAVIAIIFVVIQKNYIDSHPEIADSILSTVNSQIATESSNAVAAQPTSTKKSTRTQIAFTFTPAPSVTPTTKTTSMPLSTDTNTPIPSTTPTLTVVPPTATPAKLEFTGNKAKVIDGVAFPAGIYRAIGTANQNGITVIVTATKGECGQGTSFFSKLLFNGENGETTFGSNGCEAILEIKTYGEGDWKLQFELLDGS